MVTLPVLLVESDGAHGLFAHGALVRVPQHKGIQKRTFSDALKIPASLTKQTNNFHSFKKGDSGKHIIFQIPPPTFLK